jgi:hypothetical protein
MSPLTVLGALGTVQQLRASVNGWSHRISVASIFGAAAFVLGLVALIFIATALFFALADRLSPVAAAGIVAAIFLVLATVAGLLARHAIKRGRAGTAKPAALAAPLGGHHDPLLSAAGMLSSLDSRTLFALGAGLIGGLLATQLRSRTSSRPRADIRQAAE